MQFYNTPNSKKENNKPVETNSPLEPITPPANTLKIITLSGTESVTKNLTVYEYDDEIIVVDCGVGFPDSDVYGVNVVIPDFTYLIENSHKVKALFITHGHEDHLGAVAYFLNEMSVPVYSSKLVQGFLMERFRDKAFKSLQDKVSFHIFDPSTPEVSFKYFKVDAFAINHSVPSSMGFAISTPEGTVLHMADYKMDWTPVLDPPIDLARISAYGQSGVLCLLSDCLNVTTEGYSKSESTINDTFLNLFEKNEKRQIFVTTISSNISRMSQILNGAIKHGRKAVLTGRSIDQSVAVARKLGYLPYTDDFFVKEDEAADYPQGDLVYIIAGCYGQQGSALDRLSRGEHENITLENNALVIFSADPNPPGVEQDVERVMSNLTLAGAEVLYSKIQNNLHISGHGTKGDLMAIASVVKPKYFIPIGGTVTKMRAYTNMVVELGVSKDRVFECMEGDCIVFSNGGASRGERIETKPVYIDNSGTGEVNPIVIRDRDQLSTDGVFVIMIPSSSDGTLYPEKAEIVTRGFIYVKESRELMEKSKNFVIKNINKNAGKGKDWPQVKRKLEINVENFLFNETKRRPLVIAHSINI